MSEWWTYSLRDLLLFSPRTYYRLIELHNGEWWPLPLVMLGCGVVAILLAWRGGEGARRWALALLGTCWLWVAWAWQLERYATINWAAEYFAWAWATQGVLLAVAAWDGRFGAVPRWQRDTGLGIAVYALVLHPLLAPALGRGWVQAEAFGMAPDPTALFTLGALAAIGVRHAGWLLAIPIVWSVIGGVTLWAMGAPEFWAVSLAAALGVACACSACGRSALRRR